MKVERPDDSLKVWPKPLRGWVVSDLEEGEPIFVLRGRDPLALMMLMHYEDKVGELGTFSTERLRTLETLRNQFVNYGAVAQLKFPD